MTNENFDETYANKLLELFGRINICTLFVLFEKYYYSGKLLYQIFLQVNMNFANKKTQVSLIN